MERIEFIDPESKESENDVAMYNLRIADEKMRLDFFVLASSGWFNANKNRTFQDLEKLCRDLKLNTHIIAKKVDHDTDLRILNNTENKVILEYEAWFSCRPTEYAIKELLTFHESYEKNYELLSKCGQIFLSDKQVDKKIKMFENKALDIQYNKKKIKFTSITVNSLSEEIKNKYGKDPTPKFIGMNNHGGPILGFYINDKLVHNIGVSIFYGDDEQQIAELFDLRNL